MLESIIEINTIRILLALIMLSIATALDIWKREVSDLLWIVFGGISIVLLFFEPNLTNAFFNIGISLIIAPIALLIWKFGIFGGADAFCFIVLGSLAPLASISGGMITPLTTLTNAIIISISPILFNLSRNLVSIAQRRDIFEGFEETRGRKIVAMLLGYRSKNPKFSFSIEKTDGSSKKIDLSFHHAENEEFCTKSDSWVSPGLPYILYISGGFVVQLFFGDIVLLIGHIG